MRCLLGLGATIWRLHDPEPGQIAGRHLLFPKRGDLVHRLCISSELLNRRFSGVLWGIALLFTTTTHASFAHEVEWCVGCLQSLLTAAKDEHRYAKKGKVSGKDGHQRGAVQSEDLVSHRLSESGSKSDECAASKGKIDGEIAGIDSLPESCRTEALAN